MRLGKSRTVFSALFRPFLLKTVIFRSSSPTGFTGVSDISVLFRTFINFRTFIPFRTSGLTIYGVLPGLRVGREHTILLKTVINLNYSHRSGLSEGLSAPHDLPKNQGVRAQLCASFPPFFTERQAPLCASLPHILPKNC